MVARSAVVVVLAFGLLLSGLGVPAAGGEVVSPTVGERMDGVPAGEDAADVRDRLRALRHRDDGVSQASVGGHAEGVAGAAALRSRAVRTPMPFTMVGFEIPDDAEVGFRTSADGEQWSAWQWAPGLGETDGPDPGTEEAAAAAEAGRRSAGYWVGEATWLQLRVLNGRTEDVGVDLIDSLGLSRSWMERAGDAFRAAWRPDPAPAAAAPGQPDIVTRQEWGADESLRKGDPRYASRARMGVVHHTATPNTYTKAEAPGVVRAIYRYHTVSNGWDDIGYNLLIDRFGTVYEGRKGGLESAVIGAHSGGWNTGTFGVSVMGCFDTRACAGVSGGAGTLPSAAQASLLAVLAWKFDVHAIDVEASVDMNDTTRPTLVGHSDVGQTACPGDRISSQLSGYRTAVAELQDQAGGVILAPAASPSTVDVRSGRLAAEVGLSAGLRPGGDWAVTVTDPDDRVVHTASGSGTAVSARWSGGSDLGGGAHTVAVSSDGRRTATTTVELVEPCEDAFCDLGDSVHREAILRLHERGVVNGCADGQFCPSGRVTRGQMATMTARALELTAQDSGHFTDVPASHTHADGIHALYEHGIVKGDAGRFYPDREVRRDQMATFLYQGLDFSASGTSHFSDVAGNVHEQAINSLADHDVTRGDGSGLYLPARPIRRDQIASLIDRALRAAP
ncbi:MAG: S-layer homology domain-containing protein [Egibacteraceae bacterium]